MVAFIDAHRGEYGVEPICAELPIAPSTYYESKAREADPRRLPARARRDLDLQSQISRVWHENFCVYGARKTWRQLNREHVRVAKCTVERLMLQMRLQGARCGKAFKTPKPDVGAVRPPDLVARQFVATRPDQLWVADFKYVATWQGFAFVAVVIDVYSRMIVGWGVSRSVKTELVLDALQQALHARVHKGGLIHHNDRGSRYLSIRYSERLTECGIHASVGTTGDSYDNAMAEDHQRAVQGRGRLAWWPMAKPGGRRVCNAGMGGPVQQPAPARARRRRASRRVRAGVSSQQ
jgi:hypothetical protein